VTPAPRDGRMLLPVVLALLLVGCSPVAGQTSASAPPTSRPSDVRYRIALVSDPHCSPDPRYAAYVKNFDRVIDEVNGANVDGVLIAGDLAQDARPECFALFKQMAARFHAPMRCVPGNHDIGNRPLPAKAGTVTEARIAAYESAAGPPSFVTDVLPGVRVIGIASSLLDTALPRAQQQWDMLEHELAHPTGQITLVLTHYPPFNSTPEEKDEYFNVGLAARMRWLELMKRGGVTAVLSGHLHRPVTLEWQGMPIIGAPAVSFGLPEGQQQVGWRLVTIGTDGSVTSELRYLPGPPTTQPKPTTATRPAGELLRPTS
jgi:3',5'-cyclic-AMP phosphodiesterase